MSIWFRDVPLSHANSRGANSLIGYLGIELVEVGDDYLKARMPVDERTRQPARGTARRRLGRPGRNLGILGRVVLRRR